MIKHLNKVSYTELVCYDFKKIHVYVCTYIICIYRHTKIYVHRIYAIYTHTYIHKKHNFGE